MFDSAERMTQFWAAYCSKNHLHGSHGNEDRLSGTSCASMWPGHRPTRRWKSPDELKKYIAIEKLHFRGALSPIRATIKQDIQQQQKTRRTLSEVNKWVRSGFLRHDLGADHRGSPAITLKVVPSPPKTFPASAVEEKLLSSDATAKWSSNRRSKNFHVSWKSSDLSYWEKVH